MTSRILGSLLAVLLAGSLLAACDEVLTDEANARLEPLVLEAIEAAEAGDVDRASELLDGLRDEVDRLLEEGELDAERVGRILLATDQADALLALLEEDEEPREGEPADDQADAEPQDDGTTRDESHDPPGGRDDDRDDDRGRGRSGDGPPDHANNRGNGGNRNSGRGASGEGGAPGERDGGGGGANTGGGNGGGRSGGGR